jgi:hypothetical protein
MIRGRRWLSGTFAGEILSDDEGHGNNMLMALAEYLIKVMAQKPGLSREMILAQLEGEYGGGVATKVAEWEKLAAKNGEGRGTFLEAQSGSMKQALPMLMNYFERFDRGVGQFGDSETRSTFVTCHRSQGRHMISSKTHQIHRQGGLTPE